jgi:hypothetical protein
MIIMESKIQACIDIESKGEILENTDAYAFIKTQVELLFSESLSGIGLLSLKEVRLFNKLANSKEELFKYKIKLCLEFEEKSEIKTSTVHANIRIGNFIYQSYKKYNNNTLSPYELDLLIGVQKFRILIGNECTLEEHPIIVLDEPKKRQSRIDRFKNQIAGCVEYEKELPIMNGTSYGSFINGWVTKMNTCIIPQQQLDALNTVHYFKQRTKIPDETIDTIILNMDSFMYKLVNLYNCGRLQKRIVEECFKSPKFLELIK